VLKPLWHLILLRRATFLILWVGAHPSTRSIGTVEQVTLARADTREVTLATFLKHRPKGTHDRRAKARKFCPGTCAARDTSPPQYELTAYERQIPPSPLGGGAVQSKSAARAEIDLMAGSSRAANPASLSLRSTSRREIFLSMRAGGIWSHNRRAFCNCSSASQTTGWRRRAEFRG
jgi:hypothetical protein